MFACIMCGGVLEIGGAAAIAAASMVGAEVYNRARLVIHNRQRQAARLARYTLADKVATAPRIAPQLRGDYRAAHEAIFAELAAS